LKFLWRAQHSLPGEIFVASIEGLLQKTIPLDVFSSFESQLKKGDELDLTLLASSLSIVVMSAHPL